MRKNQNGITTLILLMLLSVVSIFIITLLQSRIILGLRRSLSSGDTLISSYTAETEINDVLARIIGNYENIEDLDDYQKDLPDGSRLSVDFETVTGLQTIIATTSRQYAVSKIKAERTIPEINIAQASEVEIVLVMDCTGSMGEKASAGGLSSRFYEQREAVKNFIQGVMTLKDMDRYTLSVAVYGNTTSWYKDSSGNPLKSLTGFDDLQKLYNEIHAGFGNPPDKDVNIQRGETRCASLVQDYTNTGAGLKIAEEYLDSVAGSKSKALILVTDGIPNSKTKDASCPNDVNCHGSNQACFDDSRDYLRCRLADNQSQYTSEVNAQVYSGVRDPRINTYTVTVLGDPIGAEREIFNVTVGIFSSFSDNYYTLANAAGLTETLEKFLEEIIKEKSIITIERLIPG